MLERFYDPKSGNIYIDGQDLKEINLCRLRNSIGYVSQEPVLMIGSVLDNLRFANSTATDAEVEAALRLAGAFEFA
jgi:ATP-binding cassette, subfamily B, bacterial MsbA